LSKRGNSSLCKGREGRRDFIKKPVEYHPACWVDENRFAKGDKT
jgi:hypothetical protein